MISRIFILSVDFVFPDLSALTTVPITSIELTPDIPCNDKASVFAVSPLIVNPLPDVIISPAPVPPVTTTMKESLSAPLIHLRPDPAVAVALPPLTLIPDTVVLKRPDGFIVLLLFVFLTAAYPRDVSNCFLVPSFNSGRVLIIEPITAPLASVVDPKRVTLKLKLSVTAVTFALCEAPLFENSTMSPILN